MYKKISVIAAALAVMVCLGASSASAATLYTTNAQKTAVPVGTTFTAKATVPVVEGFPYVFVMYSNETGVDGCEGASMSYKVTQNSGGVFKAALTENNTFPCAIGLNGYGLSSTLQISGSSVANGANTAWLGSTISNIGWKFNGLGGEIFGSLTSATGSPPKKGVFSQQPTAAKAPVSIVLEHAPGLNPICLEGAWPNCNPSATYTLTGAAAAYSLK
jgi:hypothetical protein